MGSLALSRWVVWPGNVQPDHQMPIPGPHNVPVLIAYRAPPATWGSG